MVLPKIECLFGDVIWKCGSLKWSDLAKSETERMCQWLNQLCRKVKCTKLGDLESGTNLQAYQCTTLSCLTMWCLNITRILIKGEWLKKTLRSFFKNYRGKSGLIKKVVIPFGFANIKNGDTAIFAGETWHILVRSLHFITHVFYCSSNC